MLMSKHATEIGIAPGRLETSLGAIFAGHIEPQPAVPGVADAHAEDGGVLDVLLDDRPARRPDESRIRLRVIECREGLHADANVAAQVPPAGVAADRLLINDLRSRQRHISRVRRRAHDDRR